VGDWFPLRAKDWTVHRVRLWIGIALVLVLGLGTAGVFYLDTILRVIVEQNINRNLKGYTAHVGAVSFHPIGFSIDLLDTTLAQTAHPEPLILSLPLLHASVQWKALLHVRLVADFLLERPTVYEDLTQARAEIRSPTPTKDEGWQQALESIYPLKINEFQIVDGNVTYVDKGPLRPLRLSQLNVHAENIRNVAFPNNVYPSTIHMDGVVFDTGSLSLDGTANFLAEPHVTMKGAFGLQRIALDYLQPITRHFNVTAHGGTFSTAGAFEYATKTTSVNIQEVAIQDVHIEYQHTQQTAAAESQTVQQVQRSAKQVNNDSSVYLSVNKLDIRKSTFGFRNDAANNPFRLYLTDTDIHVSNVSNHSELGKATGKLTGKFMGSGETTMSLALIPAGKDLDMDVAIKIEGTDLRALNDLLREYAGFDVAGGQLSFYSEDKIRRGYLTGYIKPLFRDVQVSDPRTEAQKDLGQKIREGVISVLAWILRNHVQHEVGTSVTIAGEVSSPTFSSWQAIGGLLKNAFLQPLLHQFGRG
jgi:hypothetical protein